MLKDELFGHCHSYILKKLTDFEHRKEALATALNSESKSSAGDKHETGRAMIQLEREKLGVQMAETEAEYKKLMRIKGCSLSNLIALGSIVRTDFENFYISISAGSYTVGSKKYYCISAQSPIGKLLLGKQRGDVISFNHRKITIIDLK